MAFPRFFSPISYSFHPLSLHRTSPFSPVLPLQATHDPYERGSPGRAVWSGLRVPEGPPAAPSVQGDGPPAPGSLHLRITPLYVCSECKNLSKTREGYYYPVGFFLRSHQVWFFPLGTPCPVYFGFNGKRCARRSSFFPLFGLTVPSVKIDCEPTSRLNHQQAPHSPSGSAPFTFLTRYQRFGRPSGGSDSKLFLFTYVGR